VLREAFLSHPPPSYKGRRLKLGYATQAGGEAPTVVLFVNDTGLLHFSYRRYLEHQIRNRFGLIGNPLKLVLREADAKATSAPERRKLRTATRASAAAETPSTKPRSTSPRAAAKAGPSRQRREVRAAAPRRSGGAQGRPPRRGGK